MYGRVVDVSLRLKMLRCTDAKALCQDLNFTLRFGAELENDSYTSRQ